MRALGLSGYRYALPRISSLLIYHLACETSLENNFAVYETTMLLQ